MYTISSQSMTSLPSFSHRKANASNSAATLVSEEAQDSCANTGSEPEEKERSVRLDNLATASNLLEAVVSAVRGALDFLATTVQDRVGNRVVVVVDSSSAVNTGDLHGVRLVDLLVRCARKLRRFYPTHDAACKQEKSGHAVKSGHDEARDGGEPDRSDPDDSDDGSECASESVVRSCRGHRVVPLPFGSANGEAKDDDGEDELEDSSDQRREHRGELLTKNREFCGSVDGGRCFGVVRVVCGSAKAKQQCESTQ
jgi:hypothetical protein